MTAQEKSTRSFADLIEKEDFINHNNEKRLFNYISIRITEIIKIVLMTVLFVVALYLFYANKTWVHFFMRGHWLVIGLFVLLFFSYTIT